MEGGYSLILPIRGHAAGKGMVFYLCRNWGIINFTKVHSEQSMVARLSLF